MLLPSQVPTAQLVGEDFEQYCAHALRVLTMDAVQQANSGHPGMPMGAADMAYVLWTRFLKHNPADPAWPDRDRFVLSAGHGSMLLYGLLHLTGYDLSLEDLQRFRQWGSRTPGHPEYGLTPGVEMTTGPLGQGLATAVGMALAERWLAATFNRPGHAVVDHYTYVLAGDGDLEEGISHEAASFAGHQQLGKLIVLYDDNGISIDGPTSLSCSDDVTGRFAAYDWQVLAVDGHDHGAIAQAIEMARSQLTRPTLIRCRTHIAWGSPGKQDSAEAHGSPLGAEEVRRTKVRLGWPEEPPFHVPPEVVARYREAVPTGQEAQTRWEQQFNDYARSYPDLVQELRCWLARELPPGWQDGLRQVQGQMTRPQATRVSSGQTLNALAARIANLVGGSADLTPSNNTYLKGYADMTAETPTGRNIHFGVREHAMGAILNGMTLHGGPIAYGGTFLVFSDYMRPAIRLAALMHLPTVFVFTHDSIGLGEDGPTHQPVEHLAALRAIPGLVVLRPADAFETVGAWQVALQRSDGPTALVLSRQSVPPLRRRRETRIDTVARGAYVVRDGLDAVLVATGSEVALAEQAADHLARHGYSARVVSMPGCELFAQQPDEYRTAVLPDSFRARVVIEAGVTLAWCHYSGASGTVIGLNHFGASAPYQELYAHFGLTATAIEEAVLAQLRERRRAG